MERNKYKITWENGVSHTYLYGSDIDLTNPLKVHFKNAMIPPGSPIKEWHSEVNFPFQRLEPPLPILESDRTYKIKTNCTTTPQAGIYVRINFLDRQGRNVHFFMTSQKEDTFTFPEGAYGYTVQLVQGGAQDLIFKEIEIYEEGLYDGNDFSAAADEFNVLFLEPIGKTMVIPSQDILNQIPNLAVISEIYPEKPDVECVLGKENIHKKINCIGYGRVSNANAQRLAKALPRAQAYVYDQEEHSDTVSYGHEEADTEITFVDIAIDHSYRLYELPMIREE